MWNSRIKKEIHTTSEQINAGLNENLIKRKGRQRLVFSGMEGANLTKTVLLHRYQYPSTVGKLEMLESALVLSAFLHIKT